MTLTPMNVVLRTGASLLGLLSCSLACDASDGGELGAGGDEQRKSKYSAVVKDWGCRDCGFTNSPMLGAYGLESISYGPKGVGSPNKLLNAVDPSGAAWPVYVDEFGLGVDKSGVEFRGFDLVGWTLTVKASNAKGTESKTYDVEVYAYEEVPGWNDSADAVPTYGLSAYDPGSDSMLNVCPGFDLDKTSVVFLDRELYDLSGFGVADGIDEVASIACRGHALAKMKLLQYDPHSPYFETTPDERLATLRMLTADYCGTGTSQTVLGTPLDWTDARGHVLFDSSEMSSVLEAQWSENGALCLNAPRVGPPPLCAQSLPACDVDFETVDGGAVWASMLP